MNIAENTGAHRNSVVRAMGDLEDDGLVRNKGHGVYRLTQTGRETAIDLLN